MGFRYHLVRERELAVGHAYGLVRPGDILEAVDFAFGSGVLRPSMDRIVLVDPRARVYLLDFHALTRVRDHVLAWEREDGTEPGFRVAIVVRSRTHEGIARVYGGVWDLLGLPGVQVEVVGAASEALARFGYPRSTPIDGRGWG